MSNLDKKINLGRSLVYLMKHCILVFLKLFSLTNLWGWSKVSFSAAKLNNSGLNLSRIQNWTWVEFRSSAKNSSPKGSLADNSKISDHFQFALQVQGGWSEKPSSWWWGRCFTKVTQDLNYKKTNQDIRGCFFCTSLEVDQSFYNQKKCIVSTVRSCSETNTKVYKLFYQWLWASQVSRNSQKVKKKDSALVIWKGMGIEYYKPEKMKWLC